MSEPFLAEIRLVGFNFAPRGWAFCDGQILPINQNQSLYSLLGTTYGGDGRTSFALPDLRGRTPTHKGDSIKLGTKGGAETVVLNAAEMPQHRHSMRAAPEAANQVAPKGNLLAGADIYADAAALKAAKGASVSSVGGGQGHENMQPYLAVNFCIALRGLFPSRN